MNGPAGQCDPVYFRPMGQNLPLRAGLGGRHFGDLHGQRDLPIQDLSLDGLDWKNVPQWKARGQGGAGMSPCTLPQGLRMSSSEANPNLFLHLLYDSKHSGLGLPLVSTQHPTLPSEGIDFCFIAKDNLCLRAHSNDPKLNAPTQ